MSLLTLLVTFKGDHLEFVERPGSSTREERALLHLSKLQFLFK